MLCVGNFFGINNREFELYRNGEKKGIFLYNFFFSYFFAFKVAVPTYILGSNKQEHNQLFPESGELCPNVFCLGI